MPVPPRYCGHYADTGESVSLKRGDLLHSGAEAARRLYAKASEESRIARRRLLAAKKLLVQHA